MHVILDLRKIGILCFWTVKGKGGGRTSATNRDKIIILQKFKIITNENNASWAAYFPDWKKYCMYETPCMNIGNSILGVAFWKLFLFWE